MSIKTFLPLICLILFASANETLIPGIEHAAYGYNIYKGDPNSAINDPGISHSIYEISYNQGQKAGIYSVPDFMDVSRSIRCSRYSASIIDIGMTSYSQSLAGSVGVDIGIDFIAAFSTSIDFQSKQSDCRQHNYTYIKSSATCQIYFGQWEDYLNITLSDNFRTAVEQTDFTDDKQIYDFIDQFGTHLQSQTSLGAMAQRTTSVKSEDVELMWSLGIDIKASASGIYDVLNGKVQAQTSSQIANRNYWNQTVKQQNELTIGAKMPSDGDSIDWQNMVENDITSIKFMLGKTIDSLLTSKYFPNDEAINLKQYALANAYTKYCFEHLTDCTNPDLDPELRDAENDLHIQNGHYGQMLYCDTGNSIVGTCGSGQYADCNGAYHQESCSTGMKYQINNYYEHSAGYGQWQQCQSGSIVSLCRSGMYSDCGDGNHFMQMGCAHDIPVMRSGCTQVMGWYGEKIYCPDGHVATGTCESGKYADCKGWDNKYHYTGLYCCPIGSKDDGYPKWIYQTNENEISLNEDNNSRRREEPQQPKKVLWDPKKNSTDQDSQ